jgi:tetratricopeptide (TPR) repeat protein
LAIARQIAEGLGEAHKLGITHRDLKPGNVMIDKDGQAKVMDFGIARSLHGGGITAEGGIIGTPEYMSPEQVEGKPADPRADIYALGIILFEMVTGRVPFEGETPFSIANKQKSEPPPVPKKLAPQIPEGLNKLILRCLEKDKAKRYQTAEELLVDLAAVEDSLPTTERVVPRRKTITHREVTVKFQPRKLLIPALAVSALAIILVFFWRPWSSLPAFTPPPKIENSIAVVSFRNQTGDANYDGRCFQAIPDLLITNLENAGQFYVATWERMTNVLEQMGKKEVRFIDSELGFELSRREGIAYVVSGSLTKSGEMFVTDIKLWDAESRKLRKAFQSKGKGEDSILETQIGELSRGICEALGLALEKIGPGRLNIAGVTTSSLAAYENYLKGREYYWKFRFKEAKSSTEKAIEIDPSFAMAYRWLAVINDALGDPKARNEAITKAKEFSAQATDKEKLYIEAHVVGLRGDFKTYIQMQDEIIRKYPKEKEAHWNLGKFFSRAVGWLDSNRAIQEFEKVLELDPNFASAYNMMALRYLDLGRFEKAIELLEKYASVSPGNANPFDSIGYCYYKMGKLDKAILFFKKAIKINPDDLPGTYWSMAYVDALNEDYAEALSWIDRLIGRTLPPPAQVKTFLFKGFLNLWLGRFEQSMLDFKKAEDIGESAGNKEAHFVAECWRSIAYMEKGEFDLSRQYLDRWLTGILNLYPSFAQEGKPWAGYLSGLLDLEQGKMESAKKQLEEMKSLLPAISDANYKDLLNYLNDVLACEIDLREGKPDIASIVKAFSEDRSFLAPYDFIWNITDVIEYLNAPPYVRDFIPRAYLQEGKLDQAIAAYERLITFNPESKDRRLIHPLNYYRMGKVYEQKGEKRKAKANYRKFLDLWKDADPGLPEVEGARKRLAAL